MLRKAFILLILLFIAEKNQSTPTIKSKPEWFSIKQGLSQGMVSSVIQDKEGFMWFATKDGLNRYDGYKVKVFRHTKDSLSLPENYISSLLEDDYGNFWVGTNSKGVYLFDKRSEKFFLFHACIPRIGEIKFSDNKLFIRELNNLFCYEIKGKINTTNSKSPLPKKLILNFTNEAKKQDPSIEKDYNFTLHIFPTSKFIICRQHELSEWSYQEKNARWVKKELPAKELKINEKNWFRHGFAQFAKLPDSLYILNDNEIQVYDIKHNKITDRIDLPDKSNVILLNYYNCISDSELYFRLNNSFVIFNIHTRKFQLLYVNPNALTDNQELFSPYFDKNGILWQGSNGWGVYKTDLRTEQFTILKSKFSWNSMMQECLPSTDRLPLHLIDDYYFPVKRLVKDSLQRYWYLKSKNGLQLYCYNLKNKKITRYYLINKKEQIGFGLFGGRHNQLWFFSTIWPKTKMICQINTESGKITNSYAIPINDDFTDDYFISQTYSDDSNRIWLATERGLICLNTNTKLFTIYNKGNNAALGYSMYSICADPINSSRILWMGTNGNGLIKYDLLTQQTRLFTTSEGLPNNVVYNVVPDHKNRLWLSTNKGLCCFSPENYKIKNFTEEDGLANDEFNRYEFLKLNNNKLLFGGMGGYTVFDPDEVMKSQPEVPIVFTGLRLSGKEIEWDEHSKLLSTPIQYADKLTLNPEQKNFTITYASLEYRKPLGKLYKYRLVGFEKEWSEPENKNEATFTNLSPGTYTLQVTGCNSDGIWNSKGTSLIVIVLPAWHQTWWFKLALLLATILMIYALYQYRLRQQLRVLQVRNRIASDLHDEIGSTLSNIAMYSEAAQHMEAGNQNIPMFIETIHNNSKEVLESMSDIVWAVNTKNDHLYHLLNRMRNFAIQLSEVKGFELKFTNNNKLPNVDLEINTRKNIYLIFKEAINNAAKYSQCKTIWVELELENQIFHLRVKDDGIGFNLQHLSSIDGGNGLFNLRKRASDIGGKLSITSDEGQGSVIDLKLKYHSFS